MTKYIPAMHEHVENVRLTGTSNMASMVAMTMFTTNLINTSNEPIFISNSIQGVFCLPNVQWELTLALCTQTK